MMVASLVNTDTLLLEVVGQTLDERQLVPPAPDGVGGENTGSCRPRPVC